MNRIKTLFLDKRWSIKQSLEADFHKLYYLFLEVTRQCNLSCKHCGSDCTRDEKNKGLKKEVILNTLKKISSKYDSNKIMVVITGGEPLLRKDLIEIITTAKSYQFRIGMVTNGYSMTKTKAIDLAIAGLESVVVSLDGPQKSHNWLRNKKDSFTKSCKAITNLLNAGIPIVEAVTCVTPASLSKLEETYEIVKNLGATHWRVFNIFPAGRALNNDELLLKSNELKILVTNMADLRIKGKNEGLNVNLSEEGYLGWEWESKLRDTPYFCRAGINIAGIMADGSIAACPNLPSWMNQGNVLENDFIDIWENKYHIFRNRSWTKKGKCEKCKQWNVCRGNSLHLYKNREDGPCWCHYYIMNE